MTKALLVCLYLFFSWHVALAPATRRTSSFQGSDNALRYQLQTLFNSYNNAVQSHGVFGVQGKPMDMHTLQQLLKNAGVKDTLVVKVNANVDSVYDFLDMFEDLERHGGLSMSARDYKIKVLESETQFVKDLVPIFSLISHEGIVGRYTFEYLIAQLAACIHFDGFPELDKPDKYWNHFSRKGLTLPQLIEVFRAISIRTGEPMSSILTFVSAIPVSVLLPKSDVVLNRRLFPVFRSYAEAERENRSYVHKMKKDFMLISTALQIVSNADLTDKEGVQNMYERFLDRNDVIVVDCDGKETVEYSNFLKMFEDLERHGGLSMRARDYKIKVLESETQFVEKVKPIFVSVTHTNMVGRKAFKQLVAHLDFALHPGSEYSWRKSQFRTRHAYVYFDQYAKGANGLTLRQLVEVFRAISIRTEEPMSSILDRATYMPKYTPSRSL